MIEARTGFGAGRGTPYRSPGRAGRRIRPLLAGAVIRPAASVPLARGEALPADAESGWKAEDARLFAITFAAGFLFFLTFLG